MVLDVEGSGEARSPECPGAWPGRPSGAAKKTLKARTNEARTTGAVRALSGRDADRNEGGETVHRHDFRASRPRSATFGPPRPRREQGNRVKIACAGPPPRCGYGMHEGLLCDGARLLSPLRAAGCTHLGARIPFAKRGRGTMRSMVEGAATASTSARSRGQGDNAHRDEPGGRPLHRLRRSPSPVLRTREDTRSRSTRW